MIVKRYLNNIFQGKKLVSVKNTGEYFRFKISASRGFGTYDGRGSYLTQWNILLHYNPFSHTFLSFFKKLLMTFCWEQEGFILYVPSPPSYTLVSQDSSDPMKAEPTVSQKRQNLACSSRGFTKL